MPTRPTACFPIPALEAARLDLEAALRAEGLAVGPARVLRHAWQDAFVAPPSQVQVMLEAPMPPPLDRTPRALLVRARFGEGGVRIEPTMAWRVTVEAELIFPHGWTTLVDMEAGLQRRYGPLGLARIAWETEDAPHREVVWATGTWQAEPGSAAGAAKLVAGLEADGMLAHLPGIEAAG